MTLRTPVSPMQCRLLSELAPYEHDGASPAALVRASGFARPTVDALLGRLFEARCVSRIHAGAKRSSVRYRITAKGVKARERFAAACGLEA